MENEMWMPCLSLNNLYEASNLGLIRSVRNAAKKHIMKPSKDRNGYLQLTVNINGKYSTYMVSRLVWEAFNGPIPKGMQINHLSEDKTDNRLENLNLMTPKENTNWGTRNKRISQSKTNGKRSKEVLLYDENLNYVSEYPSLREAERKTGINTGSISSCCHGKSSKCKGADNKWYIFKLKKQKEQA